MAAPLDGITVVDFSQFLAGPYCSLRLLDLGARVIKVENPDGGDLSRRLYLSDTRIGEDSTLFHAINRGKESIALDLKTSDGVDAARTLVGSADIVIQNFRPGVIERLGLDYGAVRTLSPTVVYGSISGYGPDGPWANLPGQDLLAQARSGVMWLNGNRGSGPVPIGLPIADMTAGANLAQGILAALFRRERHNIGALVETSLLEAMVDIQFEFLTTYLNNGRKAPQRMVHGSSHGYLAAPYGVFEAKGGHLVLAMSDLALLERELGIPELKPFLEQDDAGFRFRDQIHDVVAARFALENVEELEARLTDHGIWCARVIGWDELFETGAFKALDMLQNVKATDHTFVRSPIRIDQQRAQVRGVGPKLRV